MKTIISMILLLSMIMPPLPVMAAEERTDSLTVGTEIRHILGVGNEIEVMRIYYTYFMYDFARNRSIQQITDSSEHTYYAYPVAEVVAWGPSEAEMRGPINYVQYGSQKDGFVAKEIKDGIATEFDMPYYDNRLFFYELRKKQDDILATVDKNIVAKEVYYLDSRIVPGDMAAYYVTNRGDYVLFTTRWGGKGWDKNAVYFLPFSHFLPFVKKIQLRDNGLGGDPELPKELEGYRIDLSALPDATVSATDCKVLSIVLYCAFSAVVIATGVVCIIRHRRKKKISESSSAE